jgi:hypothetical protein
MALGITTATSAITSDTDTAVIAAPGAGQQIYIIWLAARVKTAGASGRLVFEMGSGGTAFASMSTATADTEMFHNYATGVRYFPGLPIGNNVALNAETSGGNAADVDITVCYEVKG